MLYLVAHAPGADLLVVALIILVIYLAMLVVLGVVNGGLTVLTAWLARRLAGGLGAWAVPLLHAVVYLAIERWILPFDPPAPWLFAILAAITVFGTGMVVVAVMSAIAARRARPATGSPVPVAAAPVEAMEPLAGGAGSRLLAGLATPLDGLVRMVRCPALVRYAIVPILLNLLITAIALAILVSAAVFFIVRVHPRFSDTWWGWTLEILTAAAFLLCAGGVALAVSTFLNGLLCSHFHEKLARAVDIQMGLDPAGIPEPRLSQRFAEALGDVTGAVPVALGLLAMNILPVIGSIGALGLGLYLASRARGRGYFQMPMNFRGLAEPRRQELFRRHWAEVMGVGLALTLFSLVPVAGSALAATAAAGIVPLYRRAVP